MILTIIDECTHNKTFSVYDKPNGTIKILEDSGFHLNPRVHADPLSRASLNATDGSQPPSTILPPRTKNSGVREPPDIFGKDLVME